MKKAAKHEPSVGVLHLELQFYIQLLPTMCLVNCCVVNVTRSKTIFPWSILSTGESGVTVKQLYEEKVVNTLPEVPHRAADIHMYMCALYKLATSSCNYQLQVYKKP